MRLWTIALVAKEFGVLPTRVARDLDDDPEQLSLLSIGLLRYAECKAAFDDGGKISRKPWEGSKTWEAVEANAFALAEEELEAAR